MKKFKITQKSLGVVLVASSLQISCASASGHRNSQTHFSDLNQLGNANWQAASSMVQANQGNGFLVTKNAFDNFYLRVEFAAGVGTNSGIFIRCADPAAITDKTCYEINIFDTRADQTYRTGAITHHVAPKAIINSEDGKWHTYKIYAAGGKIRVLLNGRETAFLRNESLSSGHVALQFAQGEIKFRNLEIRPLSSDALDGEKTVLEGVWELESMGVVDSSGKETPWCVGSFGVIIYANNFMSTAVNCTSDPNKSVLYAGPFEIRDQSVFHHAQNYGAPNLNRIHSRNFKLIGKDHLELSGALGGGKVIVRWVRR